MNSESDTIQDKLALLRLSYRDQLPAKMTEITDVVCPDASSDAAEIRHYLETLEGMAHKLAGSGATFGFPDISVAARFLEHGCEAALNLKDSSVQVVTAATAPLVESLQKAVEDILAEAGAPTPDVETVVPAVIIEKILLIVSDDTEEVGRLSAELENSGFAVHHTVPSVDLQSTVNELKPSAIVVEALIDGEEFSGLSVINTLRQRETFEGPLVVISDRGDIQVRLNAARANADAYMIKPIITSELVDVLDQHLSSEDEEDFRILIVDDDVSTAKYTEVILQGAGMVAEILTNPMQLLEKLDEFGPELILMDLYMPECSGQELAIVVRQQESFSTLPIVFLSGESDIDKQLVAMRSGGDDFLTKPIKPQHLISSVRSRVKRFRLLRSRMVRDSMTGLLNHTTTHEFLENEVARALRNKSKLSVAALDIDHFKAVNDVHGHGVGDQVIKSLSRLLKQRLRSNDVIGRMGGEEFAAVLSGTSLEEAEQIFNGIRQAFSDIDFPSGDKKFSVTLSCGLAEYPGFKTPVELLEAADKALYVAKNSGRNRVVIDSH
ncbi:MAG: diguanylate cyclase [Rhodospirillales bacterium]|nr:diguanylate cyclase [Rhodospirillales bacterium]